MIGSAACGYHNANVYAGPEKKIYILEWKNRTSQLTLGSDIYRSLITWFQKSGAIEVVRSKSDADLVLAGEIISIDLPSFSYRERATSEVQVNLRVRYIIKDIATNEILLEVPSEMWTEEYLPLAGSAASRNKESEAIDAIVDDLSKRIYQQTLRKLNKSSK